MRNKTLLIILALFLALRMVFSPFNDALWWDSAVYLSIGKYFLSLGKLGLLEPIRPPILPLMLGIIWKLGLDPIIFGRILQIFFAFGTIFLTYVLGKRIFGETAGLVSAFMLSMSPTFFFSSSQIFSEIPSTFFALLALLFFVKDRQFLAGLFAAVAFLTRYPQGIMLVVLCLLVFVFRKNRYSIPTFFAVILPFLILNKLFYNDFLFSFTQADVVIKSAGLWLFTQPWYYYFVLLVKENAFYVLGLIGVILFVKMKKAHITIIPLILFFLYFTTLPHKEGRFMIVLLPYLAIVSGAAFTKIFKQKKIPLAILIIVTASLFFAGLKQEFPEKNLEYYKFSEGKDVRGEILTSTPLVALYTPKKVGLLYYPVFNYSQAKYWKDYIGTGQVSYVFFETCSGGIMCAPNDVQCEMGREALLKELKNKFSEVYKKEAVGCEYSIFQQLEPSSEKVKNLSPTL